MLNHDSWWYVHHCRPRVWLCITYKLSKHVLSFLGLKSSWLYWILKNFCTSARTWSHPFHFWMVHFFFCHIILKVFLVTFCLLTLFSWLWTEVTHLLCLFAFDTSDRILPLHALHHVQLAHSGHTLYLAAVSYLHLIKILPPNYILLQHLHGHYWESPIWFTNSSEGSDVAKETVRKWGSWELIWEKRQRENSRMERMHNAFLNNNRD